MSPERILLVEDDARLAQLTADYLRQQGFLVEVEPNGTKAVSRIEADPPALVILDIGLPGEDGLSVCRRARVGYLGPILMLTARGDDVDQVVGLELGADDYLAKPASPRVLLARVRALLRRVAAPAQSPTQPTRLEFGSVVIDGASREVLVDGKQVPFTTTEFDLLWLLGSSAGTVLDRDAILGSMRGIGFDGLDRSIDMRISKIRKKIGDDPKNPQIIKTVRGSGYLFARRADA